MAEARKAYSLRRRLPLLLSAAIAVVWLATAVYSYFEARHEVDEVLDAHLAQSASLIVAQAGHELEEIDVEHAPQLHERGRRVAFQIWERGSLRLHSSNAPETRLSPREEGFSRATLQGRSWRVFSTWDSQRRYLVQVAERDEARREIATGVAASLLVPLLVALPVLGFLIWLAIVRALRPLTALGRQVETREPGNLAALDAGDAPLEIVPLVRSLNALFARVASLIENERRFTADAAHELRTPLAALRAQAQVALGASDDAERRRALGNVIAGCDRATRLAEQMLTLARLEPGQVSDGKERCELGALARSAAADLAPAALLKDIELEVVAEHAVEIDAHPALLAILLRNLIDNAIRYSMRGGRVRVAVTESASVKCLEVSDEGHGIDAAERAKVGQRFYRVLGTGETGSGLGLSIVYRIAAIHGAAVTLGAGLGGKGLRVTVELPR